MAVEELGRLIAEEQIRILRLSPADHRCALIELARAMDAFWVRTLWKQDDLGEPDDLYPFAWNKALSLFMNDACEAEGAPLIPSSRESQEWADSVLQLCGRIAFCEHLLELTRAGLVACSTTRADEYKFQPIVEPFGVESIERSDFQWVRELIADAQEGVRPVFDGARSMIGEAMSERVNRWRQHFIKYETSPEIDDYFEGKGVLCAQLQFGQDSFPAEANFGGIEFNSYRACLALLMGWNLKHFAFCRELLRKHAELDARNLSTVFHRRGDMADWVADAFDLDKQTWTTVLDVLTLDRANLGYHTETVCGPAAPLMKIGADHVLQPLFGTAMNPFFFLLRELRRRFRADWDRNVNDRESSYRAELYQLFPQEHIRKTPGNIRLRSGGATKTDVDAAVLDRRTGAIGLFQLKWQDPFGFSMRERASRSRNFIDESKKWVEATSEWLETHDADEVLANFGFGRSSKTGVKPIRLFVLGRNFAHFSGGDEMDDRAAWGTWPQLLRHAHDDYRHDDPIEGLYHTLRADSPRDRKVDGLQRRAFRLGDQSIVWDPCVGDEPA